MTPARAIGLCLSLLIFLLFIGTAGQGTDSQDIPPQMTFQTKTVAVCEDVEAGILCTDRLFVECNGTSARLDRETVVACDAVTYEAPKVSGSAVFRTGWTDPRQGGPG